MIAIARVSVIIVALWGSTLNSTSGLAQFTTPVTANEISIIDDTRKMNAEAKQIISEVYTSLEAENSLLAGRSTNSTSLKRVRATRAKISKRIPELRVLIDTASTKRSEIVADLQKRPTSQDLRESIESWTVRLEDSEYRARRLIADKAYNSRNQTTQSDRLADLKKKDSSHLTEHEKSEIQILTSWYVDPSFNSALYSEEYFENEGRKVQLDKARAERAIKDLNTKLSEGDPETADLKNSIQQSDKLIATAQGVLRETDDTLSVLDDLSGRLLETDLHKLSYTDRSTWVFGLLVGAVIVGFFVIAFRSPSIQTAIFAGDSGIQFITLFSLVIAIILFGVLNILEGRELAALLGGLSGYILGRGTTKTNGNSGQNIPSAQS